MYSGRSWNFGSSARLLTDGLTRLGRRRRAV